MTKSHSLSIFICHTWQYDEEYQRLANLLIHSPDFNCIISSYPSHDKILNPTTNPRDKHLLEILLEKQIHPSQCVLVLPHMNRNAFTVIDWLEIELSIAKNLGKSIIVINSLEPHKIPPTIRTAADNIVNWNTTSIIETIIATIDGHSTFENLKENIENLLLSPKFLSSSLTPP